MSLINIENFKDEKGHVNWKAFDKAQIDNGDNCYQCGHFLLFGKGHREICYDCKQAAKDKGEITHEKYVRCPKCAKVFTPDWESKVFQDGENEIWCYDCDIMFPVQTRVTYRFTSPPLEETK